MLDELREAAGARGDASLSAMQQSAAVRETSAKAEEKRIADGMKEAAKLLKRVDERP